MLKGALKSSKYPVDMKHLQTSVTLTNGRSSETDDGEWVLVPHVAGDAKGEPRFLPSHKSGMLAPQLPIFTVAHIR